MEDNYNLVISIVNFNGEKYISDCIDLVLKAKDKSSGKIKIICIDNHSEDGSRELLEKYPEVEKFYLDRNIGYAAAHNMVLTIYNSIYFLLLNPDTLMNDEFNLVEMLFYMDNNSDTAIATCSLLDAAGKRLPSIAHEPALLNGFAEQLKLNAIFKNSSFFQKIGKKFSHRFPLVLNNYNIDPLNSHKKVNYIYGAYLFLRSAALDKIGKFDENFFLFWEEIDLCIRAKKVGFDIGFNPKTSIVHQSSKSQKTVPELSYYWHTASYFWIFKKYYRYKLILWSIGTAIIQFIFIVMNLVQFKIR
ncbi:MAG TPA: glycosyltransferase family 2 protein, partial [Ignavibacteriaceae bacterium]|nr:glycosyltransferase family 2 protein [Ignavibacteriaceae bacterium]